jgi:phosphatidylinositol 4-kinase
MLNAFHQLSQVVGNEEVQEVQIGRLQRRVLLLDTVNEREEILREFAQRSKHFIKTSVDWAPDTVHSHLQEYINQITKESFALHAGVALASECIQSFSGLNNESLGLSASSNSSRYILALSISVQ